MRIEIYHASKYGNGAMVAEEIRKLMLSRGIDVDVNHIGDEDPKDLEKADLYIFGSPTHFGKAAGNMMRFVKKMTLPPGTIYAVFATCSGARPDKKTGKLPSEEELSKLRRTIPMMDEELSAKGLKKIADMTFFVHPENMKGPLEDGWQARVETLVAKIADQLGH